MLTDHNNLTNFLTKKTLSGCDTHWWETLSAYHLEILHRPGRLNPADVPSRWPNYEQAEWSNQPPSAGCECSPDRSSWVLSVNRSRTFCDLSTCLLGTLGLAGTGDREHLIVVIRTIPPDQVRLIGSTGLDSGLVLVERSVKEWVGVLRDSACGLLRTVLHTRQGLY